MAANTERAPAEPTDETRAQPAPVGTRPVLGAAQPWPIRVRCACARLTAPLVTSQLRWRAAKGREDRARLGERLGIASLTRPKVPVIWVHAPDAEAVAAIQPLVDDLATDAVLLVTTATVPAALLVAHRLPQSAVHQYAPLDSPAIVARFLDHWRPAAVLWADSPLATPTLTAIAARGIPLALINAHVPDKTYRRWTRQRRLLRPLLQLFSVIAARNTRDATRLRALSDLPVQAFGDLRHAIPAPAVDQDMIDRLKDQIGPRPLWAAVHTHSGEETVAVAAHQTIRGGPAPGALAESLLIVVPRHNYRGGELARIFRAQGFRVARHRSEDQVDAATDILILDGPADAGLAFHLAPVVFVGGSLVPEGGHNPLEPAHMNCAVVTGPHMDDYTEAMAELRAAGAAQVVTDAAGLASIVGNLLEDLGFARQRAALAARVAAQEWTALQRLRTALAPLLPRPKDQL